MRPSASRWFIGFRLLALVLTAGAPALCIADDGHRTIELRDGAPCRQSFALHHGPGVQGESQLADHGRRHVPVDFGYGLFEEGDADPDDPTCEVATDGRRPLDQRPKRVVARRTSCRPTDALRHVGSIVLLI